MHLIVWCLSVFCEPSEALLALAPCRYLALGRKRSANTDEDVKRQIYGLLQVCVAGLGAYGFHI